MGDLAEYIKSVVVGIRDYDDKYLRYAIIHLLSSEDMRDFLNKDTSCCGAGKTAREWIDILIFTLKDNGEKEYLSYFER